MPRILHHQLAIEIEIPGTHSGKRTVAQPDSALTIGDRADQLWHVREHERLLALAQLAPHLMTMDEQEIWAVICEHGSFWRGHWVQEGDEEVWTWRCEPGKVLVNHVENSWSLIVAAAENAAQKNFLPEYQRRRPRQKDEIPF